MDQMSGAPSQGPLRDGTQSQFLIGKLRVLHKGEFENLTTFGEESESTIVSLFFFLFCCFFLGGGGGFGFLFHRFAVNIYLKASPERLTRDSG